MVHQKKDREKGLTVIIILHSNKTRSTDVHSVYILSYDCNINNYLNQVDTINGHQNATFKYREKNIVKTQGNSTHNER